MARGFRVSILGLHETSDAPRLAALGNFFAAFQLRLCGQLSDAEVAAETPMVAYRGYPHRELLRHAIEAGL